MHTETAIVKTCMNALIDKADECARERKLHASACHCMQAHVSTHWCMKCANTLNIHMSSKTTNATHAQIDVDCCCRRHANFGWESPLADLPGRCTLHLPPGRLLVLSPTYPTWAIAIAHAWHLAHQPAVSPADGKFLRVTSTRWLAHVQPHTQVSLLNCTWSLPR